MSIDASAIIAALSPDDRERLSEGLLRLRLLDGQWLSDANGQLRRWFHSSIHEHLPPAELGVNPFRAFLRQVTTTYRRAASAWLADDPSSAAAGLRGINKARRWAVMARVELLTRSLRDALVRVDVRGGGLHWQAVPACVIFDVQEDPERPGQVVALKHLRTRYHHPTGKDRWVVEYWDISDQLAPVFAIMVAAPLDSSGPRFVDATREYLTPAQLQGIADNAGYPRRDLTGRPILPYVLYHANLGRPEIFTPYEGVELVTGTLTTSTLMTYWLAYMRDGAYKTRVLVDGEITGGGIEVTKNGKRHLISSHLGVLEVTSRSGKNANLASWAAALNPREYFEAVQMFVQMLALDAGMSPSDINVSTAGLSRTSGVAIQVSRAGIEATREQIRPSLAESDRLTSSLSARMWNRYVRPDGADVLPEDPSAYDTGYPVDPLSSEALRARMEIVRDMRSSDPPLMSVEQAVTYIHPEWTPMEVQREMTRIAEEKPPPASPG